MKMQVLMLKFPHLPEQIFQKLDSASLFKSREVANSWQNIIDGRNYPWLRIVNIPSILKERNSYLHLAAETGQIEAFKTAFNQEGDKNIKNSCGGTPFHLASKNGRFKIVQLLLKNNDPEINYNAKDNSDGITPFHCACEKGNLDVVKIFIENAAALSIDLNAKSESGVTAFQIACFFGHLDVVKILVENSATLNIDLNAKDSVLCAYAPFLLACHNDHTDLVKIFMENAEKFGIDLNAKSTYLNNYTGFHQACLKGNTN